MGESDSEEDSDYQPLSDNEDDEDANAGQKKSIGTGMSGSRKRKIDTLWVEMQQEESSYMTSFQKKISKNRNVEGNGKNMSPKRKKTLDILSSIFGPLEAKKLCVAELGSKRTNDTKESKNQEVEPSVRKEALELIKKVKRKVKVVEKRKFAGEEIRFVVSESTMYILNFLPLPVLKKSSFCHQTMPKLKNWLMQQFPITDWIKYWIF